MNDSKKRRELTEEDRGRIESNLKKKRSISDIADFLGVHVRTIRREIQRGSVEQLDTDLRTIKRYNAYYAHNRHKESISRRGRKPSYGNHADLIAHVREKLRQKWSPDVIIGRLRHDGETTVCTKTVYNWLQRGYIRDFEMKRKQRKVAIRKVGYKNPTARRIDCRPKEANDRQAGHWEMDLVVSGKGKEGALLVFTERASRSELIYQLFDKKQPSVIAVFNRLERRYKGRFKEIFKTITCDNGGEFLDNDGLEKSLYGGKRTVVYYAHPYSSWERGSNENANKLIRKFIKKGEDISKLPLAYIKRIEKWMNNYPRRFFGYKTANEVRNA